MLIEEIVQDGHIEADPATPAADGVEAPDGFDEREFVEAAREQASQTLQTLAVGLLSKPAQRARVMQTPGLLVALIRGAAAPVPPAWAPSRCAAHCGGSLAVLGHRHPRETEDEQEDDGDKCSVCVANEEVLGALGDAIARLTHEDKDAARRTCRAWGAREGVRGCEKV